LDANILFSQIDESVDTEGVTGGLAEDPGDIQAGGI